MNYLIHSTGRNWVKRKPIARLFEPIGECTGRPDDGVTCAQLVRKDQPGTFAERNAKREKEKCKYFGPTSGLPSHTKHGGDGKATDGTDIISPKSNSSQPEFKVGDLVECLPPGNWKSGRKHGCPEYIGTIAIIIAFDEQDGEDAVNVDGRLWPLRALRHAETEPSSDDGWIEVVCSDTLQLPNWLKRAIEAAK